ncbi:hypothetical protein L249_4156 [Ophiocordyceps polyrhachis-furcata BCC 54312]|uniref:Uncharacterized protein n=1 Tax=Ophiocordyceps polyrhachis-furcata BCC 54312 TaxID=1330021 RepID=A0A367L5S4_9HYPO|nr:hypothetical protein L249_4156 [Ophiocordyceps polyrhachis-furcata BCC 54312]
MYMIYVPDLFPFRPIRGAEEPLARLGQSPANREPGRERNPAPESLARTGRSISFFFLCRIRIRSLLFSSLLFIMLYFDGFFAGTNGWMRSMDGDGWMMSRMVARLGRHVTARKLYLTAYLHTMANVVAKETPLRRIPIQGSLPARAEVATNSATYPPRTFSPERSLRPGQPPFSIS